jgi:hypothetical protein
MRKTAEGANAFEHALDHAVEFFSKAGSQFAGGRKKKGSFYEGDESALSLFQKTWIVDPELSFKLLLWLRDCRGGAGNRSGAREIYEWLAKNDGEWLLVNLGWLPLVGRWDDLRCLFGTTIGNVAAMLWAKALGKEDVLAAKWADRTDKPLQQALGYNEKRLRKFLSRIRKNHIVEYKMCANLWNEIVYKSVPSVAMARYTKAFGRHDEDRFNVYKDALEKGEETIKAGVLFPHDCVRTAREGDARIADAQFEALPNYMDENVRAIVIADTSGSMSDTVSGSIARVDVSQGMALYCSSKIPKDNPFYKKFVGFSHEGKFVDWNGLKFSQAVGNHSIFDGAVGSTHIGRALRLIYKTGKFFNLKDNQMPNMLIIVSDMQFHESEYEYGRDGKGTTIENVAEVDRIMDEWQEAGFSIPQIVYWNVAGYAGQPATAKHNNVALVSGFSPSILKAIFACEDLTPRGVMLKAVEKYKIAIP